MFGLSRVDRVCELNLTRKHIPCLFFIYIFQWVSEIEFFSYKQLVIKLNGSTRTTQYMKISNKELKEEKKNRKNTRETVLCHQQPSHEHQSLLVKLGVKDYMPSLFVSHFRRNRDSCATLWMSSVPTMSVWRAFGQ